jgi:hypothetical protein
MMWRVERQEKSLVGTDYIVVYDDYLKPRLQLRTFTAIALEPIAEERHLERRNESFGSRGKDPAAT